MAEGQETNENGSNVSRWTVFYFVLSVILGIIAAYAMDSSRFGFFSKFFGFLLGTCFAYCGTIAGDFIRKLAMPDAIMTSGMTDTLKQQLFWFIGPQVIGGAVGAFIGAGIVGMIAK